MVTKSTKAPFWWSYQNSQISFLHITSISKSISYIQNLKGIFPSAHHLIVTYIEFHCPFQQQLKHPKAHREASSRYFLGSPTVNPSVYFQGWTSYVPHSPSLWQSPNGPIHFLILLQFKWTQQQVFLLYAGKKLQGFCLPNYIFTFKVLELWGFFGFLVVQLSLLKIRSSLVTL